MMVKNTNLKSMAEWQEERMTSTFFVLSSICCSTQTDLSPDCGYDDLDDDDYDDLDDNDDDEGHVDNVGLGASQC